MRRKKILAFALAMIMAVSPLASLEAKAVTASDDTGIATISDGDAEATITGLETPTLQSVSDGIITLAEPVKNADGFIYKLYEGWDIVESEATPFKVVESTELSWDFMSAVKEYANSNGLWGPVKFTIGVSAYADVVSGGDALRIVSDSVMFTKSKSFKPVDPTIEWSGTTATISTISKTIDEFYYDLSVDIAMDDGSTQTYYITHGYADAVDGTLVMDFTDYMKAKGTYKLDAVARATTEEGKLYCSEKITTEYEYEGVPSKNPADGLTVPTNLAWTSNSNGEWNMHFDMVDFYTDEVDANIQLYCNDEYVHGGNYSFRGVYFTTEKTIQAYERLEEEGDYKFRVRVYYRDSEGKRVYSDWSDWSEVKTFTKPDKKLDTPVISWNGETGTINLETVEGADFYAISLYKKNEETGEYKQMHRLLYYASESLESFNERHSEYVLRWGAGEFVLAARALSYAPEECFHSDWSEMSAVWDTRVTADKVDGALDAVLEDTSKNAEEKVEAVKESLGVDSTGDLSGIQSAMQTDDTVKEKIATLEEQLKSENNIKTETVVSEKAKEVVDVEAISMVGAAFSGKKDSTVSLNVDVAPKPVFVDTMNNLVKTVPLNIKLTSSEGEVGKLAMPITIKMPVPAGLSHRNLVIFHVHQDGSRETIVPRIEEGSVIFTVTEFSTFVFAEVEDTDDDDDDDVVTATPAETVSVTAPKTGDAGVMNYVLLALASVVAIMFCRKKVK